MASSGKQNLGRGLSLEDSMERIKLLNASSTLITQGPPERRLLNTRKEEIDKHVNIRRLVFGVKNPQKMMRTIVLLGETGTGKSTLINVMTNYILGVEWSDNIQYEIKEEEKHQSESHTSEVTVYEICGYEDVRVPFSLRIIDTPGYGDTHGETVDKLMVQSLFYLFQCEEGVHQLDAVCLVVKVSQNRLTPHQRCIFNDILCLFENLENNIIPIITYSGEGKLAALAALDKFGFSWPRDENNSLIHFRFDNTPAEDADDSVPPNYFKETWEKKKNSMEAFFKYLNKLETKSLVMTHDILFKREEMECLQDQIVQAEHLQNELRKTQEALEKNKEEMEEMNNSDAGDNFFVEKVESEMHATYCKKCKFTCHYPCTFFRDAFFWCTVTRFSNCISCPGKCSLSDHVTEKRCVPSVENMRKKHDELKWKYEKSLESLQKNFQEELSTIENEKQKLILESYNHVIRLNEIALRPESLSILPNLNFLIEKLRETNQSDKVQELEDIYKRSMKAHNLQGGEQFYPKIKFS